MAEAHAAVAFSFSVTPEGVNVDLNHEALHAIWKSGVRSWKKRMGRAKNQFLNGVYPATPFSWLFITTLILALVLAGVDPSLGLIRTLQARLPGLNQLEEQVSFYVSVLLFATVVWIGKAIVMKYSLKCLLYYHNWMYEPRGRMSLTTKLWLGLVKVMGGKKPLLMSYQNSLPKLPVPSIKDTCHRYLQSVRCLLDDEKYSRMEKLAKDFESGLGNTLQRYLILKSWWSTNYVSDWWEEYVYLQGRSPIMINSNFYAVDAVFVQPTKVQAARAANIIYAMLLYRRELDREELNPILLNKTVPLCSNQYERQFNTTRIPGKEKDKLVHLKDSQHIAVYCKGKYFKVYIYYKGRLLRPCELERVLQKIIDDDSSPAAGEEHLASLTAGDRVPWAKARAEFFSKGKNKAALDAVEKAAFFLALDDEPQDYDPNDPSKLTNFGRSMLHGNGYNRWFDKSFSLAVTSNGRIGFNGEHSWADAPIMAHLWEYAIAAEISDLGADAPVMGHLWEVAQADDRALGYAEDGHTKGQPEITLNPIRLEWDLPQPCIQVIEKSLAVAKQLINDVDLCLLVHNAYGKGFIKTCKMGPDAFIQIALQLAYFRCSKKFCLTYESSMTRLFKEGRTETVRSCTMETCEFVRSMEDPAFTNKDRIKLMMKAADNHQMACRDAMTGKGIDRHLFCLYVVSKYLGKDSPFLSEVLSEPWRLSTSQTPHQQTNKLDLVKHPEHISAGGGFGPVADDGYGVSYIIAGEDVLFFHISCKKLCPTTSAQKFGDAIETAMADLKEMFLSVR